MYKGIFWIADLENLDNNKPYNYYPRGRIEVKNNQIKMFINPNLAKDEIILYLKEKFEISEDVLIIKDGSEHYKCYLD